VTATLPVALTEPDLSDAALAAVTAELAATAQEYDRSGAVPAAGIAAVHRAGLLTATVAERYGGPAVGQVDVVRILVALGEGDPSVALLVANTLAAHQGQAAAGHWPGATYAEVLRRSAVEPTLVNAIRAEPELGAPARGGLPATVARRTADGWSLSGHKAYATGGTALAYHVVWAVADEPDRDGEPRVGHLLVPGDAPGISWLDTWDHLGLRASNTHDVVYDGVALPADAFVEIPRVDGAYRDPAATTGPASFGHPALVGESGSGKTTAVRLLLGLEQPDGGRIVVAGEELHGRSLASLRSVRRHLQLVYQNPFTSLDPTWRVERLVREPLDRFRIGGKRERAAAVRAAVASVGLGEDLLSRRPTALSGGQRQRVAIARALVLRPDVIVLDEPTSALDVSVQAGIVEMLLRLQVELGLTYVFVSHDLSLVRQLAHTVSVMRDGRIVEHGTVAAIFDDPREQYTRTLLDSLPGGAR
jgi:ABC-type dipeptide/oligopeptide/nickel transport system ATPase subunit